MFDRTVVVVSSTPPSQGRITKIMYLIAALTLL